MVFTGSSFWVRGLPQGFTSKGSSAAYDVYKGQVIVPREREGMAPGDEVDVLLYDDEPREPAS